MHLLVSSAERGDIFYFLKDTFKEENKAREYMEWHSGLTVIEEELPDKTY